MASPKAIMATARERVPLLDHLVRAYTRYQADAGDRLAAGVTYFWFLSLFPILLLAVSILGYALGADAEQRVVDGLGDQLPAGLAETLGQTLTEAKGPAGIIGVVGLLFAGLGWVDALREAIRTMWHQNVTAGNIIVKKLRDIVVLIGLFAVIGASVVVTGLVTGFSDKVLDLVGLETGPIAKAVAFSAGVALTLLADTALFLYLFVRLSRVQTPVRAVLRGAVFGAVGFEVLKVVGGIYVARTTSKGEATYGTFAVVVGLLLFLYLLSRLILFSAVFAVTTKGDSDIAPSGTADAATALKAGVDPELADHDPDDPPTTLQEGVPTPLLESMREQPDPQEDHVSRAPRPPRPPARSWSAPAPVLKLPQEAPEPAADPAPAARSAAEARSHVRPAASATALADEPMSFTPSSDDELAQLQAMFPPARPPENGQEEKVVLAARATAVAGGALLAGTSLYALSTVRRILSRRH